MNTLGTYPNHPRRGCSYHMSAILACALFAANAVNAGPEQLPKLPSTVVPPSEITLACINASNTLPALDICRANFETAREHAEEYNQRIWRFCNSLTRFDAKLRSKALANKLSWDDYDDLKENILAELEECNADTGDYYAPYRARIREYKRALELIKARRDAIVNRIDI